MRSGGVGLTKFYTGLILASLALAGCVPGAYVQDYPQDGYYYGSGGSYYRGPYSNYYGYPGYYGSGYYGSGYYGSSYYYRPRVVYYDHDHDDRDCRHESHRDRRQYDHQDRHDRGRYRDQRDTDRAAPAPHALPPSGSAPMRRTPRAAPQASAPPPKAAGKPPEVESERETRHYPGDRRR